MKPLIGILDCNNFFVSCERLFRPDLRDQPVVVLSNNDGCVVARSQEVKDIGVPMGVPYFKVKDMLQKHCVTVFSSNFALYRDLSHRVFRVMRDELAQVEQYSVDEAFFTITTDPKKLAAHLKCTVEQQVGIPVSVGVAHTKTQAKYANDVAKRAGGVFVCTQEMWRSRIATIKLSEIWGVGPAMALRYQKRGFHTVADLLVVDRSQIAGWYGIEGVKLQQELSGMSVSQVTIAARVQKSIMSSRSFAATTTDKAVLLDALQHHVRQVASELRAVAQTAGVLRISALPSRHGDFMLRGGVREARLPNPTNDTLVLTRVALTLLDELYEPGVPYKKAGVTVTAFSPAGDRLQLFETESTQYSKVLLEVIDQLNIKAGREVVIAGTQLRTDAWRARAEKQSPKYTTTWTDVPIVCSQ